LEFGCKWVTNEEFIKKFLKRMKEGIEQLDEKIDKYKEAAEEDFNSITKENVIEESNANIGKYQRWLDRLLRNKLDLNKLINKKNKMETEIYHYYRNNCDLSDKIKYDSTANKYVQANDCFISLNELIMNKKALINFIEGIVQNLHNRNFTIKNIISVWTAELGDL